MSGLFSSPKAMQPLPAEPKVDQASVDRENEMVARRRRGRAATVLAGADAKPEGGSVATKQLLGG